MSLRGNINKIQGDFSRGMRNMASKGLIDPQGAAWGTRKIIGYVCEVHPIDDENDELAGTVDVQEFDHNSEDSQYEGVGLHKGVLVSAIQNNKNGVFLMPMLYSDVVITQDPTTLEEYVLMCSHVDIIQMESHQTVKIGVTETKEFVESDDSSPDYDDLEKTGNASETTYDKEKILHKVKTPDGEVTIKQTASSVEVTAKDSVITIDIEGKISIQAKDVSIKSDNIKTEGNTEIAGSALNLTATKITANKTCAPTGTGPFCGIRTCPFTGMPHVGSELV